MGKSSDVLRQVSDAVAACEDKKAEDISIMELDKDAGSFTDYFVVCSGSNPRQIQTISDEVQQKLAKTGVRPAHVEGYQQAEWVLLDYVDFVVHVFSARARSFYNLERLWKSAKPLSVVELRQKARGPARAAAKKAVKKPAAAAKRTKRAPAAKPRVRAPKKK
jgi:ribosome-associated protein